MLLLIFFLHSVNYVNIKKYLYNIFNHYFKIFIIFKINFFYFFLIKSFQLYILIFIFVATINNKLYISIQFT